MGHQHAQDTEVMNKEKYATREETAKIFSVTAPTISVWLERGWLKGIRLGRSLYVARDSIKHVLEHGTPNAK